MYPSPLTPIPGEAKWTKGEVFIDSIEIVRLESFPVQIRLHIEGNLPTPCNQLRAEIAPPDDQKRIQVKVWSLSDPAKICVQVLKPFDTSLPLGSYPDGNYTDLVNGKPGGEFSLP